MPLLTFMLLVHPLADYVGSHRDEVRTSFASALRTTEFGVMRFVAALRRLRPHRSHDARVGSGVLLAAVAIAVVSFVVWQVWPWN